MLAILFVLCGYIVIHVWTAGGMEERCPEYILRQSGCIECDSRGTS